MQVSHQFRNVCIAASATVGFASTLLLLSLQVVAKPSANSSPALPVNNAIAAKNSLEARLAPAVTQELRIPGAIIGVWMKDYQPWITRSACDLASGAPIKLNDKMRIGSITKTFIGTVFLQLVDEGKISLN